MAKAGRLRGSPWLALAGVAQVVGIALLPKCPLCLAMDFGILGSVLATAQARLGSLLWPSLALAIASATALTVRLRRRSTTEAPPAEKPLPRLRPCCQPSEG